jgi:hypothetical protein
MSFIRQNLHRSTELCKINVKRWGSSVTAKRYNRINRHILKFRKSIQKVWNLCESNMPCGLFRERHSLNSLLSLLLHYCVCILQGLKCLKIEAINRNLHHHHSSIKWCRTNTREQVLRINLTGALCRKSSSNLSYSFGIRSLRKLSCGGMRNVKHMTKNKKYMSWWEQFIRSVPPVCGCKKKISNGMHLQSPLHILAYSPSGLHCQESLWCQLLVACYLVNSMSTHKHWQLKKVLKDKKLHNRIQ